MLTGAVIHQEHGLVEEAWIAETTGRCSKEVRGVESEAHKNSGRASRHIADSHANINVVRFRAGRIHREHGLERSVSRVVIRHQPRCYGVVESRLREDREVGKLARTVERCCALEAHSWNHPPAS